MREGPLTAFYEDLLQDDTWYLVDTREPEKAAAKTILTTSPRRDVYKVMVPLTPGPKGGSTLELTCAAHDYGWQCLCAAGLAL